MGRGRYRSVCGPTDNPEEGLCQLETRSKSSDNGWIHNVVGRPKDVCVPPILSGGSLPSQCSKGSGISYIDCASLASSDVVSDTVGNVGISPDSVTSIGGPIALPQGVPHPLILSNGLTLAAWRVSGVGSKQQVFRKNLQIFSWNPDVLVQGQHTRPLGKDGGAGVWRGRLIPFRPLWDM